MNPTDVHPPVEHPPTQEDARQLGEQRRRCAWLLRNGRADEAMSAVEAAGRKKR